MAHKHSVYDTDPHFTINPITRLIKNESSGKVIVIQGDHNSERFTFEMPRMIEDHDMMQCDKVKVHFINTGKTGTTEDVYEVDDFQISPDGEDTVIFSWLISGAATRHVGPLQFAIQFQCTSDGEVDYAWHTAVFAGISVSTGINNGQAIADKYSDILENWREQLFNGQEEDGENLPAVGAISKRQRRPMMTFVDDDAQKDFLTKWIPIIEEKGISVSCAVVTSWPGTVANAMTWDEIETLPGLGVEVISHSHEHVNHGDLSKSEIEHQFASSVDVLKSHGIHAKYIAYPHGGATELVQSIAARYFCGGLDANATSVNIPPYATLNMARYPLGNSAYDYTLDALKTRVDAAVANGGWLIWMSHSQYPDLNDDQLVYIRELIDYARERGVEIVSLEQGYAMCGNTLESGWNNKNNDYFAVACDGATMIKPKKAGITINTPPSGFPQDQVSIYTFFGADNSGFSHMGIGDLINYSNSTSAVMSWQIWMPGGAKTAYRRTYTSSGWGEFVRISDDLDTTLPFVFVSAVNSYTFNTPIAEFPNNSVTVSYVNSTGGSGFPSKYGAGILVTYKFNGGNGYNRQELMGYTENRKWTRHVNSDGSWGPFIELGGGAGATASRPTAGISAGYQWFDTTLKKPVWYTGSGWVDATGTTA